jgi:hypothetical protein
MHETARARTGAGRFLLAVGTLMLFGHAVALHLVHGHERGVAPRSDVAVVSTPCSCPADEHEQGTHCPACQLQHGFLFLAPSPALLRALPEPGAAPELEPEALYRRHAGNPTSGRAPPVL